MNNITIYIMAKNLVTRLETNPDSSSAQIKKAIGLLNQVNYTLDTHERRKK